MSKTPERQATWTKMQEMARESACEEYLACFIILAANDKKYGELKQELHNQHLFRDGRKVYPDKIPAALQLLNSWKGGKLPCSPSLVAADASGPAEQGNMAFDMCLVPVGSAAALHPMPPAAASVELGA